MTIVIARAKPINEIVVRSPHLKKLRKPISFIRKGPLKNLSIRNPIGNSLVVKKKPPNLKEVWKMSLATNVARRDINIVKFPKRFRNLT